MGNIPETLFLPLKLYTTKGSGPSAKVSGTGTKVSKTRVKRNRLLQDQGVRPSRTINKEGEGGERKRAIGGVSIKAGGPGAIEVRFPLGKPFTNSGDTMVNRSVT